MLNNKTTFKKKVTVALCGLLCLYVVYLIVGNIVNYVGLVQSVDDESVLAYTWGFSDDSSTPTTPTVPVVPATSTPTTPTAPTTPIDRTRGGDIQILMSGGGRIMYSSATKPRNPYVSQTNDQVFVGYNNFEVVTLVAVPDNNGTFIGWDGDCKGTNRICTVYAEGGKAKKVVGVFSAPRAIELNEDGTPITIKERANWLKKIFGKCKIKIGTGENDINDVVRKHQAGTLTDEQAQRELERIERKGKEAGFCFGWTWEW